jgi:hypothetical protein
MFEPTARVESTKWFYWVGSSSGVKYQTRLKVTDNDQHYDFKYRINCGRKNCIEKTPRVYRINFLQP